MSNEKVLLINDDNFGELVLNNSHPVLVDFWAEWCGPCKAVAPILDELAQDFAGKLTIAKINVDENQQVPMKYGIRSIPTLLLFKNGQIEATHVGSASKSKLAEFINKHLS